MTPGREPPLPSQRRRLTLFLDSLAAGGAQKQMVGLASGLATSWQTRLAWYNDSSQFHQVPDGVQTLKLPRASRTDPRFVAALAGLVSPKQTDLVHAWLGVPSLYAALAGRLPGSVPVIAGVRCSASVFDHDPMQRRITLASSFLATAVTTNSRGMADWLVHHGIARNKVHFIGNILAPAIETRQPSTLEQRRALLMRLGLDPRRPPVVALGRFDAYKNQDGLLRAWLAVRDRMGSAQAQLPPLLLAGFLEDAQRVERVRQMAKAANYHDLHIVTAVEDVPTLLEAARFSVLASRSEGSPNVVLEGLGLGTLVVATRVGEVPDLLRDGETGLSCEAEDDAALAEALWQALHLASERAVEMGRLARADMLARFAPTVVVGQYAALYREILRQHRYLRSPIGVPWSRLWL